MELFEKVGGILVAAVIIGACLYVLASKYFRNKD